MTGGPDGSRGRAPGTGVLAAALLAVLAGALVLAAGGSGGGAADGQRPFQAGVRGLGLSYAVSPAWTFHAVDPRLAPFPETSSFPLPGAPSPDPHHGAALIDLPPLIASERDAGGRR